VIDTARHGQTLPLHPSSGPPAAPLGEPRSLMLCGPGSCLQEGQQAETGPGARQGPALGHLTTLAPRSRPKPAFIPLDRQHPPGRALPALDHHRPLSHLPGRGAYLGPRPVFTNLSLRLTPGWKHTVDPRGRNGSGKSALISCCDAKSTPVVKPGSWLPPLRPPDGESLGSGGPGSGSSPRICRPTIEAACWPACGALRLSSARCGNRPEASQPTAAHRP